MNKKSIISGIIPAVILACGVMSASAESTAGRVIDDSTITAKVKAALMDEKDVSSMKVHVKTYKGQVQLNGHVDTADQKTAAEAAASKVDGVKSVQNNLEVGPVKHSMGRAMDDTAITTKVEAALAGSPVVKASQISVTMRRAGPTFIAASSSRYSAQRSSTVCRVSAAMIGVTSTVCATTIACGVNSRPSGPSGPDRDSRR